MAGFAKKIGFTGHTGTITSVSFSPDGAVAVSGAYAHQHFDCDCRVWNLPAGTIRQVLSGHKVGIYSTAFSPVGSTFATGGAGAVRGRGWLYDHSIRIWSGDGAFLRGFGDELFFAYSLAFCPKGRLLLSGSGNHSTKAPSDQGACCRLWDAATGLEVYRFGFHRSAVRSVAFSADGKFIAAGSSGQAAEGVVAPVRSESRTPVEYRTIRMWERETGKELDLCSHRGRVNTIAYSPDGQRLLSAGQGLILWDLKSGEAVTRFAEGVGYFHCAAMAPSGGHIAVGTGGQSEPGSPYKNCRVQLYDCASGKEVNRWEHRYPVTAIAFSPTGELILAGGEHGELHLWPSVAVSGA